jgi:hypothetical protein
VFARGLFGRSCPGGGAPPTGLPVGGAGGLGGGGGGAAWA